MQSDAEIHRVEAAGAEVLLLLLLLAASPGTREVFTPEIGTAVGVRDVEEGDTLQRQTVGEVQADPVTLKATETTIKIWKEEEEEDGV